MHTCVVLILFNSATGVTSRCGSEYGQTHVDAASAAQNASTAGDSLGIAHPPGAADVERQPGAADVEPPAWSSWRGDVSLEQQPWSCQPGAAGVEPPAWSSWRGAPAWSSGRGAASLEQLAWSLRSEDVQT